MRKESIELCCAAPEDLLGVRADVEPGMPVDAIGVACDRALAVLYLLSGQFTGPAEQIGRYSDAIIFNAITDVQGTIENIRALALHGQRTTEPAKAVGGEQ